MMIIACYGVDFDLSTVVGGLAGSDVIACFDKRALSIVVNGLYRFAYSVHIALASFKLTKLSAVVKW